VNDCVEIELAQKRLEITKHQSNAALNFLKRLYDRRPIWERYLEGNVRLHLHYSFSVTPSFKRDIEVCIGCRPDQFDVMGLLINDNEAVMLVEVGEVAEQAHTVPTRIRLASLNQCDVCIADSQEIVASPSLEDLRIAFNRKLDILADAARVLLREGTGNVIQGIAKAVGEFANTHSDLDSEVVKELIQEFTTKVKVQIFGRDIRLMGTFESFANPNQMFVCPIDQGLDLLNLIHFTQARPTF